MKTKKIMAALLGAATMLSATTGLAANEWKFKDYDTNDYNIQTGIYNKRWYEVDGRGVPTGNEKTEGVASNVEWRHDFYERDYPHQEIVRLYLDGQATGVIKDSGAVANWETKFEPEMWEVKYPYQIHERLKSNVPGIGWRPNTLEHRGLVKTDLLKYLGKNEPVTESYKYFGFGPYRIIDKDLIASSEYRPGDVQALYNDYYWYDKDGVAKTLNGDYIVDARKLYKELGIDPSVYTFPIDSSEYWVERLSAKDATGHYEMSNLDIANMINIVKSEYLVGNDYVNGGKQNIDVATYYTKTKNADMFNPHFILCTGNDHPTQISWTNEMYEKDSILDPIWGSTARQYQFLIVDGVVCDGRQIGIDENLNPVYVPYVYRYTGGYALGLERLNSSDEYDVNDVDSTYAIQAKENEVLK
jgi:hypothetical protein